MQAGRAAAGPGPGGRGRAQRGEEQGDRPSPVAAAMREARHREHRARDQHGGPRQLEGHERSPCAGPRGSGNGGRWGFLPTASLDTGRKQGGGTVVLGVAFSDVRGVTGSSVPAGASVFPCCEFALWGQALAELEPASHPWNQPTLRISSRGRGSWTLLPPSPSELALRQRLLLVGLN